MSETITLLDSDALDGLLGLFDTQWGIFDQNGDPVITADTVVEVGYRREYKISDFPIEEGSFASYNKVQTPYDVRVTFAIGGSVSDREAVLIQVGAACASLDLYSVVTPEFTYPQANVVHYDYRRTARRGLGLMEIEVWVEEVRQVAAGQFTPAKTDNAASPANGGTVSTSTATGPQAATVAQQSTISNVSPMAQAGPQTPGATLAPEPPPAPPAPSTTAAAATPAVTPQTQVSASEANAAATPNVARDGY